MVNWSQIPDDLLSSIGIKLDTAADRIRFRAVSKSWRCILPFRQPPWLMLAELEDSTAEMPRGFFRLGEQRVYEIDFPKAHHARAVGSSGNWLVTTHEDGIIRLLNPFSESQIDLPSQDTFEYGLFEVTGCTNDELTPKQRRDRLIEKVILSSSPSRDDCIVLAIHHYWKKLAITKPGDTTWVTVETTESPLKCYYVHDAIFYKNQFYTVNFYGFVMLVDIGDIIHPPRGMVLNDGFETTSEFQRNYLVEWCGELLVVIKFIDDFYEGEENDKKVGHQLYTTNRFEIYKLDLNTKKWSEVKSLGEHALFLGFNNSVSLLASDYPGWIKKNCIYFTDDFKLGYVGTGTPGGHDMGVFDLSDKSIRSHYTGDSTSLYSPPLWIIPNSASLEFV